MRSSHSAGRGSIHGLDVVKDDLFLWVHVLVAMEVTSSLSSALSSLSVTLSVAMKAVFLGLTRSPRACDRWRRSL